MRHETKAHRFARTAIALVGAAAAAVSALGGCAAGGPSPTGPSIADRVHAIRSDPGMTPEARAIAVDRLTQSEVGKALSGGTSP